MAGRARQALGGLRAGLVAAVLALQGEPVDALVAHRTGVLVLAGGACLAVEARPAEALVRGQPFFVAERAWLALDAVRFEELLRVGVFGANRTPRGPRRPSRAVVALRTDPLLRAWLGGAQRTEMSGLALLLGLCQLSSAAGPAWVTGDRRVRKSWAVVAFQAWLRGGSDGAVVAGRAWLRVGLAWRRALVARRTWQTVPLSPRARKRVVFARRTEGLLVTADWTVGAGRAENRRGHSPARRTVMPEQALFALSLADLVLELPARAGGLHSGSAFVAGWTLLGEGLGTGAVIALVTERALHPPAERKAASRDPLAGLETHLLG